MNLSDLSDRVNPDLLVKARQKVSSNFETEINTSDGELLVLFHDEKITQEEIDAISEFSAKELQFLLTNVNGFIAQQL